MASNLITLAEYKTYKNINSTNQDAQITSIIAKVSTLVKTFCNRTFIDYVDDNKVEVLDGGCNGFMLAEFPIISVVSVEESPDFGKTYTALVEYDEYALKKESAYVLPTSRLFYQQTNAYKVTYKAGYADGLPEDLKLAVLDLVEYYIKNDGAVHSPKAPGTNSVQIEYISTTNLPAHIKRILDMYVSHYG